MNKKIINVPVYIWAAFAITSLLFVFFPQIDIFVSSLFYTPQEGFSANGTWYEDILYNSIQPVVESAVLIPILIWIYNLITKKDLFHVNKKVIFYLLLVVAIAPGIIVNDILKDHWGRARPAETTLFGGHKEFTPAFVMSDQDGYSFSCGHAAGAFFLIALALLAKKRRAFWMSMAVSYGLAITYVRIAVGGHFLSDTVVSFFIVYITTLIFYGLFFGEKNHEIS
jgi:lipid A 4'-phosphatase